MVIAGLSAELADHAIGAQESAANPIKKSIWK
jgi:hypothetical protein